MFWSRKFAILIKKKRKTYVILDIVSGLIIGGIGFLSARQARPWSLVGRVVDGDLVYN